MTTSERKKNKVAEDKTQGGGSEGKWKTVKRQVEKSNYEKSKKS